ncbi:MAG: orotate phosphoribosyltransferase [DPANN group archaeon]|nr:orotate phosphoribosyltransferase [DPANN group archaeon]
MSTAKEEVAELLLRLGAVKLNYKEPFTFTSGIRSPIYCDNRIIISHPKERDRLIGFFLDAVKDMDFDIVAGVATSGIPYASIIAERLGKPLIYIRSGKKAHGAGKQVEGDLKEGQRVLVIEDLISTGGSSAAAVNAAREAGALVSHCVAIFTYGLDEAGRAFQDIGCQVSTLTDFTTLIAKARAMGSITREEAEKIQEWNKDPSGWAKRRGS